MTLTDFLLARIAEDEAVARQVGDSGPVSHGHRSELMGVFDRDYGQIEGAVEYDSLRVLAECDAKRRIVEERVRLGWTDATTLRLLALPYADHPDYREEWKP